MNDEQFVQAALRAATADVSAPAMLLDSARLGGRRRRARRRLATVGGAAATVLVISSAAYGYTTLGTPDPRPTDHAVARSPGAAATVSTGPATPTACAVERLPIPGGHRKSLVTGGDRTGRFLLGRSYPGGWSYPVIVWDNGVPRSVTIPGADQELRDINSAGIAVGDSFDRGDVHRSWLYRDGAVTALRGSPAAHAAAVGETGILVGGRRVTDAVSMPVVWPTPDAAPVDLPVPAGWSGRAVDVDTDGTIVGWLSNPTTNASRGYVWSPDRSGRWLEVPVPDGATAVSFTPDSITGRRVTGSVSADYPDGSQRFQTVIYSLDTGTVVLTRSGSNIMSPNGISTGVKILSRPVEGGPPPQRQLTLVSDAGEIPLPPLHSLDFLANLTTTITDDGLQVGGQSNDASGEPQAVRWRCS